MKTSSLLATLTALLALAAIAPADDVPAPADPAADSAAAPAEAAPAALAAPAETAGELTQEQRSALSRELWELSTEISAARKKAAESADVQALQRKAADLSASEKPDVAQINKLNAEARTLTERHLAEMPGMAAKLARLLEVGELLRRDLPAEKRRKGPRLPPKAEPPQTPDNL